ncbi:MAG: putative restriction endonuclease [Crocinitomicaceae bacterium]|jgi:putative restriction endonuclease
MANNWTRTEHVLVFNLYWRIPFGKVHKGNPELIELAKLIGRSPSSVGMKFGNFARLDPALKSRGISGLSNGAKGEVDIWEEFHISPENLAFESEVLRAKLLKTEVKISVGIEINDLPRKGIEREVLVKQRVNQSFFRRRVLTVR